MKTNLNIEREIDGNIDNLNLLIQTLNLETNRGTGELASLLQLNYHQFESPTDSPTASECRGLIINTDTMEITARPFKRFFNVGQPEAATIDWETARVQDKADGSLIIAFYYKNKWNYATRGSVGAYGNVGTHDFTFNEFVQKIWTDNNYVLEMNPDYTYLFELISPENRIVVNYTKQALVLLAAINKADGSELDIRGIPTDIEIIKQFDIRSFDQATKALENASPMETEGFVVVDANFNRVKIKSPKYLVCHRLRDKASPKGMLNLIRIGEESEFVSYFPEYLTQITNTKDLLKALDTELMTHYLTIKDIQVQKEFAQEALKSKCSGALFALRNGKSKSIYDFLLHSLHEDRLLELLGL